MKRKMLINAVDPEELRVAIVEDGRLEFFYSETAARAQTRANIYKGVVANVEPSLQAAFIDYGQPRHGFLQIGDVSPELMPKGWEPGNTFPPIRQVLNKGQKFLVQVVKEETGNKGAALTTNLSLPGQCLVLTVGRDSFGVSRKIEKDSERKRLKKILSELKASGDHGIIARTAAEGRSKKDIQAEVRMLRRLWKDVEQRAKTSSAPSLIHKEDDLAQRSVRDFFTSDVSEILVDVPEVFERVDRFVSLVNPRRKKAVKLYQAKGPIFNKYDVELQLQNIYEPSVLLPSGGSIVIQPTEALVSVDVNSGKAIKGKEIEATALAVNLEAAAEVARQLRLRDLGGLIVIDFIDMRDRKNQKSVRNKLKEELKKDKAKTTVGTVGRFGLVEMSRQRIRPPVDFGATRICPHCGGRGILRSVQAAGRAALRDLERKLAQYQNGGVRVFLPPETARYLSNNRRAEISRLETGSGICVELAPDFEMTGDDLRIEKHTESWTLPAPGPQEPPAASQKQTAPKSGGGRGKASSQPKPKSGGGRARPKAGPKPADGPKPKQGQGSARSGRKRQAQTKQAAADAAKPASSENGAAPAEKPPARKRPRRRRSGAARRRARARKAAAAATAGSDKSRSNPGNPKPEPQKSSN